MFKFKKMCFAAFFLISIQTYLFSTSFEVRTSMNLSGETIAVWNYYDGFAYDIQAAFLSPNSTWSPPSSLSYSSLIKNHPIAAINDLNHAIVLWTAIDPLTNSNVLYMKSYNGTLWDSSITQLSNSSENVFMDYEVKISDNDWVVITWSSYILDFSDNTVNSISGNFGSLNSATPISL